MQWKSEYHPDWQRKFALMPKMMNDKTMVWLEHYWTRYVEKDPNIDNGFCCGYWECVKDKPQ